MSSTDDGRPPPPHVLVFPFPAQGHMIPLLDLAHHLALRGLSVTVLVTPKNLPLLDPLLSRSPPAAARPLVLPFPPHPSLPEGVENVKDVPFGSAGAAAISHALASLHDPILQWARSHPSPPVAVVSDFFLGWTHRLAADLGVPRVAFYSSGALLVSVLDHLWLGRHRVEEEEELGPTSAVSLPHVPGSPSFPYRHLPSVYRRYRKGSPEWEFMRDGMIANISGWAAVLNTFRGLEDAYLDHLRREHGHGRVWAVGPLLPLGPAAETRGGQSSVPIGEIMAWLDSCAEEASSPSVVYACFGSQFVLTWQQGEALAAGLERSGARFIWCVKDTAAAITGDGEGRPPVVPEGFRERTAGRGMVIEGWAPQMAILGHRAVGSFLTHCGWNSVLEGLAAGVALLAWPMEADQFVNARLLVEEKGVGVRVCEGAESVPDPDELARILAESVAAGDGRRPRVRDRAAEMGRKAVEAVVVGGTSSVDLDGLVNELSGLSVNK